MTDANVLKFLFIFLTVQIALRISTWTNFNENCDRRLIICWIFEEITEWEVVEQAVLNHCDLENHWLQILN